MFWSTKSTRPRRPGAVLRTRLTLEQLDVRAMPGSVTGTGPTGGTAATVAATAPQITSFSALEQGQGWYCFTGQVQATTEGGITVDIGGVPSLMGESTVTASDGSFMAVVQLKTDGSDAGTVTAEAVPATGQESNPSSLAITPFAADTGSSTDGAAGPQITSFTGEEVAKGVYWFVGQVQATPANGLTVNFGGVPSLEGQSTKTVSDGSFSLLVDVKTDGSDSGTATAQAVDANGVQSNEMILNITPT